jgi:hypothetical protein
MPLVCGIGAFSASAAVAAPAVNSATASSSAPVVVYACFMTISLTWMS